MKFTFATAFLLIFNIVQGQVLIHSHNDYEKPEPLFNALRYEAFAIEADVYLVDGVLAVAHDRKDIAKNRTLTSLYLDPIDSLMRVNNGFVSRDKKYRPVLVVDIKADGEKVLAEIVKLTEKYPRIFNGKRNKHALYILVSGDRGKVDDWAKYPPSIKFDGRPSEVYDQRALAKVVTISESYGKYYHNKALNTDSLQKMISQAHQQKKLVRLWGAPDVSATWISLRTMGVDIINTDKVEECRKLFDRK